MFSYAFASGVCVCVCVCARARAPVCSVDMIQCYTPKLFRSHTDSGLFSYNKYSFKQTTTEKSRFVKDYTKLSIIYLCVHVFLSAVKLYSCRCRWVR
jgi:hypothetical protein